MAKWNLFNRSKKEEQLQPEDTPRKEEPKRRQMIPEPTKDSREAPIKEYNETLYSKDSVKKQQKTTVIEKKQPLKRTSWENADIIEQNVDNMRRKQQETCETSSRMGETTDKKVDFILLKKKRKF